MSCGIDEKEGRHVVVTNLPPSFWHADMKETVHMALKGNIAEHIVKLEPTIWVMQAEAQYKMIH